MSVLRPFKAFRPVPELADKVAAPPYDVLNTEEAREFVKGNPYSFLHVDKAEIDMEIGIEPKSTPVYERARDNLYSMIEKGIYVHDENPCFYIYTLEREGKTQRGLVGCASIDEYIEGKIKKHENTLAAQEQDRINHVDYCNANTGPIFLAYKGKSEIDKILDDWQASHKAVYDFVSEDNVRNICHVIDDKAVIDKLQGLFADVDSLYIADGHHRNASAVKVGIKRREANPDYTGDEEFNFYLCVVFPKDELTIIDYNRVVTDFAGDTAEEFIEKLKSDFDVSPLAENNPKPQKRGEFTFYTEGKWYLLKAKNTDIADPVKRLDVSILQDRVLDKLLGITDPRNDSRVAFVGGARGLEELTRLVDSGEMKGAFALYPTAMDDLMEIADLGRNMPPKSTWFEPKLKSGIFIHTLD